MKREKMESQEARAMKELRWDAYPEQVRTALEAKVKAMIEASKGLTVEEAVDYALVEAGWDLYPEKNLSFLRSQAKTIVTA